MNQRGTLCSAASVLVALAALALVATRAEAIPFQIVKTFDSALTGTASFEITIEKRLFGVG